MAKNDAAQVQAVRRKSAGGYKKGGETRQRILRGAIRCFGRDGIASVTTRRIAAETDTSMPALAYYFGSKEGLYVACAREIVADYVRAASKVGDDAARALREPVLAGEYLRRIFDVLIEFMLAAEESAHRRRFVQREIADRGPAFEILRDELWRPGIGLASKLLYRAADGGLTREESETRIVLLLAGLGGVELGMSFVGRATTSAKRVKLVQAAVREALNTAIERN